MIIRAMKNALGPVLILSLLFVCSAISQDEGATDTSQTKVEDTNPRAGTPDASQMQAVQDPASKNDEDYPGQVAAPRDSGHEEAKEDPVEEPAVKPEKTFEVAVIETRFGKVIFELYPEVAPNHVENFKKLATDGFYDGTTFHRVVPGFVIQGGDPLSRDDDRSNDGTGGPDYKIDAEFNAKKHFRGTVSMARLKDKNSAGSQFFICLARQPSLDDEYTIFGKVIDGINVVNQIGKAEKDSLDNPVDPIPMEKVYIETWEK